MPPTLPPLHLLPWWFWIFKKILFYLIIFFIFLPFSGLSCGTQGIFVEARGLFGAVLGLLSSWGVRGLVAPWHVGSYFPDQGSNPRSLHWKADSSPLDHRGSPLPWRSVWGSCATSPQSRSWAGLSCLDSWMSSLTTGVTLNKYVHYLMSMFCHPPLSLHCSATPPWNFPQSAWYQALGTQVHHCHFSRWVREVLSGAIWQTPLHIQDMRLRNVSSMTNPIIRTWAFQGQKEPNYLVNSRFFKRRSMNGQTMKTGLNQKQVYPHFCFLPPTFNDVTSGWFSTDRWGVIWE